MVTDQSQLRKNWDDYFLTMIYNVIKQSIGEKLHIELNSITKLFHPKGLKLSILVFKSNNKPISWSSVSKKANHTIVKKIIPAENRCFGPRELLVFPTKEHSELWCDRSSSRHQHPRHIVMESKICQNCRGYPKQPFEPE